MNQPLGYRGNSGVTKTGMVVMRQNETLRRQLETSAARAERLNEIEGTILYLDEQHFTRDCVAHELARRLPEFTIVERPTARDVVPGEACLANIALIILHVHADRMNLHANNGGLDQNGIAVQLAILEEVAPDTPRVLMSEAEVPEDILEAFRRHVRGYVPTTLPIKQVAEAIRFVAAGGTFVPESILFLHRRDSLAQAEPAGAPAPDELADFSPRQNEVLRMLWNGSSNKVIAYELRMSESTVKVHIRHIMKKLNVNNRTQVVLKTRPQQLGKSLCMNKPLLPSRLRAEVPGVPAVREGQTILGQTGNRTFDLIKADSLHNDFHRG